LDWLEQSCQLKREGRSFVIASIVDVQGSAARNAGVHLLVEPDGRIHGTIGGGEVEREVIQASLEVLREGRPALREFINDGEEGRPMCGGKLQVFLEPCLGSRQLYIFGGGHVGAALARVMSPTDFAVTIIDEREEYPAVPIPGVNVIHAGFETLPPEMRFDAEMSHVVVVTYSHDQDLKIVRNCLGQPLCYLGMIASRAKAKKVRQMLTTEGFTEAQLEQLIAPIGLPGVGGKAPAEIAVSIAAQLLQRDE